ncbi:uncharacterized protein SOCE836_085340 [Sorangium cellulosum]|uniref:Uncharacterized protein n=1 Tax=Sorangium cellulosum TaxID=56 RepID=A0A4P2R0A3_SORCE|nr:uncharacterized protein SOCE836_085340 [Sorangium cellulosum]WCQ95626.1 hypothetical protein NQZ70_08403 [Sorangium sp. Soce836]
MPRFVPAEASGAQPPPHARSRPSRGRRRAARLHRIDRGTAYEPSDELWQELAASSGRVAGEMPVTIARSACAPERDGEARPRGFTNGRAGREEHHAVCVDNARGASVDFRVRPDPGAPASWPRCGGYLSESRSIWRRAAAWQGALGTIEAQARPGVRAGPVGGSALLRAPGAARAGPAERGGVAPAPRPTRADRLGSSKFRSMGGDTQEGHCRAAAPADRITRRARAEIARAGGRGRTSRC